MKSYQIKLDQFKKAYLRLADIVHQEFLADYEEIIRDALIQRFEFCYELAWKLMKEYLEDCGIAEVNSPKAVIKEAYAIKLITDEDVWLSIIKDRNLTSHTYEESYAKQINEKIKNNYIYAFERLLNKIENSED